MESTTETSFELVDARFEACAQFHASDEDILICACGWLDEDHGELAAVRMKRRQLRPRISAPVRRAS
jgi:hypothetical protein